MISCIYALFSSGRRLITEECSGESITVLPAGFITIQIEGNNLPSSASLDGKAIHLSLNESRSSAHFIIDAHRSVGFHTFEAGSQSYLFGTEDAKLRMDGIQTMLEYIEEEGLSWGSQLFFSDGTAIRNSKVDYAWLIAVGPQVIKLAHQVAARPHQTTNKTARIARPLDLEGVTYPDTPVPATKSWNCTQ